ncbi:MAG: polyprenyl synthetase family protein [Anaerolineae bacterium]
MTDLSFLNLVKADLERVEALLKEHPPEQHEAISLAVDHLIDGGGKRLRPTLVLLSAYLCEAPVDQAILAAAAAEMLHTATLVHDDLIDGSLIRRGVETLNASWTPAATILTGDYVFARAAHLVARTENVRLTQRFAETLMVICNGEIRQMFNGTAIRNALEDYEQRIYAKTASLIALSAEAGAILGDVPGGEERALRTYGKRIGTAFQIVDDVLDFVADEEKLGKPVGSDLRQGLATLPVLLYLEARPGASAVRQVLDGDRSDSTVEEAVQAVIASPAIEEALTAARQHADRAKEALQHFASSTYRTALLDLADFTVDRRF